MNVYGIVRNLKLIKNSITQALFNLFIFTSLIVQVKTKDFEVVGTNKHRDDNKNVAWNDAVEINFKSKFNWKGMNRRTIILFSLA